MLDFSQILTMIYQILILCLVTLAELELNHARIV